MALFDFSGKTVLISGASRGIGSATAMAFANAGARVAINYRADLAGATGVLNGIIDAGGKAILAPADIADAAATEKMVGLVESALGPVDILVNNAAAFSRRHFLDVSADELDVIMNTNFRGLFLLSQIVARGMSSRKTGAIVHVSSILAQLAVPTRSAYAASKGALESLTRAMALDLAESGIRVNAVSPGLIQTDAMLAGFTDPRRLEAVQQHIPFQRFGTPDEIAQAILFLASPAASYISGVILGVDGALGAREAGPVFSAAPSTPPVI